MLPIVSITLVTYNSERFVEACLKSLLLQRYPELEIIVVDNASQDGTLMILERFRDRLRLIRNRTNLGFAAAQNQAIAASSGDWVLVLNPDVCLTPSFVEHLVEAGEQLAPAGVGTVCGKLLLMAEDMTVPARPSIDSTGIYFTPALRHFDRGSRQPAAGLDERAEFVFGASAAAAMYRRQMIDDIAVDAEFFDADFFMYREDADVAWRAQLMNWKCLYVPQAIAYHARTAHSSNRSELPAEINMHSVKNRFLMRIKNMGPALWWRKAIPMTMRDLGVLAYCLLVERSSLRAFSLLARAWKRACRKRAWIQQRRRVPDSEIARWFRFRPVAFPVPPQPLPASAPPRLKLTKKTHSH